MQSLEGQRVQTAASLAGAIKAEIQAGTEPANLMEKFLRSGAQWLPLEDHDEMVGLILEHTLGRNGGQTPLSEVELVLIGDCLFRLAGHGHTLGVGAIPYACSALVNAPERPAGEEDKIWLAALEFTGERAIAGAEIFPLYEQAIMVAGAERGSVRVAAMLAVPTRGGGLDMWERKQGREAVMQSLSGLTKKQRRIAGGIAKAFTDNPRQLADAAVEVAKEAEKRSAQF